MFFRFCTQLNTYPLSLNVDPNMAKKTFETALTRLEQITEELDDGNLSLESSLKKFDEGIKLAGFCTEQLSEARAKVELLLEKDGQLEAIPFDGQESGHKELPE
jgi:exodeoxyribonuclease VII small subunit